MNTTLYLDEKDIQKLSDKYVSFYTEVNKTLNVFNDFSREIKDYPKVENKRMVGLFLGLESWKNLNKWIIEQTTELKKPKFRDAVLTVLGVDYNE